MSCHDYQVYWQLCHLSHIVREADAATIQPQSLIQQLNISLNIIKRSALAAISSAGVTVERSESKRDLLSQCESGARQWTHRAAAQRAHLII